MQQQLVFGCAFHKSKLYCTVLCRKAETADDPEVLQPNMHLKPAEELCKMIQSRKVLWALDAGELSQRENIGFGLQVAIHR